MLAEVEYPPLQGLVVLQPQVFGDRRGFFLETFRQHEAEEIGLPRFVQNNHSRSTRGVLRGLHFQARQPQGKLIQVLRGAIFDVAVDLRPGSATAGQWFGLELSDENHRQLYVPPGFAHGFLTLSEVCDVHYLCTDYYLAGDDEGVAWDDPDLAINWPLTDIALSDVSLSDKDQVRMNLSDALQLVAQHLEPGQAAPP